MGFSYEIWVPVCKLRKYLFCNIWQPDVSLVQLESRYPVIVESRCVCIVYCILYIFTFSVHRSSGCLSPSSGRCSASSPAEQKGNVSHDLCNIQWKVVNPTIHDICIHRSEYTACIGTYIFTILLASTMTRATRLKLHDSSCFSNRSGGPEGGECSKYYIIPHGADKWFPWDRGCCWFSARDEVEGGKANNNRGPKEIISA